MNYKKIADIILGEINRVPTRIVCPVCNGGTNNEQCMTVYEADNASVAATCHRAHCDLTTVFLTGSSARSLRSLAGSTKDTPTPYPLAQEVWASYADGAKSIHNSVAMLRRYVPFPFTKETIHKFIAVGYSSNLRVCSRMLDDDHQTKGVALRWFGPDLASRMGAKSWVYNDPDFDGMGRYYRTSTTDETVTVIVEDAYSALVLYDCGINAVSLNGTMFNDTRFNSLSSRRGCERIIVCLDADATYIASRLAHMYQKISPLIIEARRLRKDFKDMTEDEALEAIEGLDIRI